MGQYPLDACIWKVNVGSDAADDKEKNTGDDGDMGEVY